MYDFRNKVSKSNDWILGLKGMCLSILFLTTQITSMGSANFLCLWIRRRFKSFKNITSMIAVQPLTYDYFVASMGLVNFMIKAGNKINKQRNVDLTHKKSMFVIPFQNDPMTNMDMVKELLFP